MFVLCRYVLYLEVVDRGDCLNMPPNLDTYVWQLALDDLEVTRWAVAILMAILMGSNIQQQFNEGR